MALSKRRTCSTLIKRITVLIFSLVVITCFIRNSFLMGIITGNNKIRKPCLKFSILVDIEKYMYILYRRVIIYAIIYSGSTSELWSHLTFNSKY